MIQSVYEQTIYALSQAGILSPRLEARLLIAYVVGAEVDNISSDTTLTDEQNSRLQNLLQQRLKHKPLDKILGHKAFYKYDFKVGEDVLSPRPDTEILVEEALRIIKQNNITTVADLGTGSGCIVLSLAGECPRLNAIGIDKSESALCIAQENCIKYKLDKQVQFIQADWSEKNFVKKIKAPFEMIVSNPPYIPLQDVEMLDTEVKNFDPIDALVGGIDGLDCYRQIALLSYDILTDNGFLLLEIGIGQANDVINIFTAQGLVHITTICDLSGIERCVVFKKQP